MNTIDMLQTAAIDKRLTTCVVLLLLEMLFDGAETATSQSKIERHLDMGRNLLAKGQLADALTHYHAAIEGDPNNYLTLFKRGTVYLALGKPRNALGDFSKALDLKPDFTAARGQRGAVYMKMGDYENAEKDLEQVILEDPSNNDALYLFQRIQPAKEQEYHVHSLLEDGQIQRSIVLLTQLLELSPMSIRLHELRADCYIKENEIIQAVSDLRLVNILSQDSTGGHYRLSVLLYRLGHTADALKEIRDCLKLDPEHRDCFPFYKKIKKVDKALADAQAFADAQQYLDCINAANKVEKFEPNMVMVQFNANELLCMCLRHNEQYTAAISKCKDALAVQKTPTILCDRADAYIETEMFDDAVLDYQAALEIDQHFQRAKVGIERARKLQKQSERRDYYKILNVKRSATKQEIIKAYRKAAQKWHPDAYQDDEKKIAEKKFIDIAAAKEVLTDPEKRKQFDMGEDPLDPESNQHGFRGGNPFHHFQYGGSPFQFKFHFN